MHPDGGRLRRGPRQGVSEIQDLASELITDRWFRASASGCISRVDAATSPSAGQRTSIAPGADFMAVST